MISKTQKIQEGMRNKMRKKMAISRSFTLAPSVFGVAVCLLAPTLLVGCLQTREGQKEQEEKQVLRRQLNTLQTSTADSSGRFQDLEDENRRLAGRVEALEFKLAQVSSKTDKTGGTVDAKIKESHEVYKEEFAKINGEISQLKEQLNRLSEETRQHEENRRAREARAAAPAPGTSHGRASDDDKNAFTQGEQHFDKKAYKEAILDFEKYRSKFPKGKNFPMATLKIGLCFQELGMAEEAKAFYEEVIAKFPKSKEADKATARIRALNKKKK